MEFPDDLYSKAPPHLLEELDKYTREIVDLLLKIQANQTDKDIAFNALLRAVFAYLHRKSENPEEWLHQMGLFSKALWRLTYDFIQQKGGK